MSPHMFASKSDTTSEDNANAKSKCPYYNTTSTSSPPDDADTSSLASSLQSLCPAFENGTCPFAAVGDDEEKVRDLLLHLPASHHDPGALQHVLQEIVGDNASGINTQFCAAMEQYSLASMIHRFVLEHGDEDEHEDESEDADEQAVAQGKGENIATSSTPEQEDRGSSSRPRLQRHSLSVSFKEGTAASHQAAENVHFVRNFVQGKIDRTLYEKMLVQLYYVYEALETALLRDDNGVPASLTAFHTQLVRTQSLREDLSYWLGIPTDEEAASATAASSSTAKLPPPSPATVDYVQRIQQCSGIALVAHAYTRYMGDLSGGRVLQRVVRRVFGKHAATDFYTFTNIQSIKRFKDAYRAALDAVPCDVTSAVHEANLAFVLNMRLFEELDVWAHVPGASLRPWDPVQVERERVAAVAAAAAKHGTEGNANECPFIQKKQKQQEEQTSSPRKTGRCPWPFILLHDPVAAMADWQTWAVVGLLACYLWSLAVSSSATAT